jgi:hypothetical protein
MDLEQKPKMLGAPIDVSESGPLGPFAATKAR